MLSQKSINPKKNPLVIFYLTVSKYSTTTSHGHCNQNWSRRQEEESRNVKVSVWWDFENCGLTNGVNVYKVSNNITAALRSHGIKGPVTISAFGDVLQLSRANQEALSFTGINLFHVPYGGKNSADRSLLVDLMYWVSQNPPPAHLFLISGDKDFASTLHRLRMNNYNILLASPEHSNGVLCSAASIMWQWHALLKGENFIGKHFNQPPDGSYNSWYGHSRIPLENPFSLPESTTSRVEELSDTNSDAVIRPIPKFVMKQLHHILSSHPLGISITDLRAELIKNNVVIDKEFYGHKKFSRFLLSLPHILRIQNQGNGQFLVSAVPAKYPESTTSSKSTMPGESNFASESPGVAESSSGVALDPSRDDGIRKLDSQDQLKAVDLDAKQTLPLESGTKGGEIIKTTNECQKEIQDLHSSSEIISGSSVVESPDKNQLPADKQNKQDKQGTDHSASDVGFLRRFSLKWFGNVPVRKKPSDVNDLSVTVESTRKDKNTLEKHNAVGDGPLKSKADEKCVEPMHSGESPVQSPVGASTIKLNQENKDDKSVDTDVGLFSKVMRRFQFWRTCPDTKLNDSSMRHDLFSNKSFWSDIETFLHTPKGAALVQRSENRGQMADSLKKEGPLVLRSFSDDDINELLDLLVSEKKWVEECPMGRPCFKLTRPALRSYSEQPQQSNGLSSFFLEKSSQTNMQKLPFHDKPKDISSKRPSASSTNSKSVERSRSEVLADCRRLVKQVLKEHPEGYNIGSFRKLFLERYNYPLDLQKLGYQKLASLLQIIPGVKIESTYILPSDKVSKEVNKRNPLPDTKQDHLGHLSDSDDNSSDALRKNVDVDSVWEELGPVAMGSQGKVMESKSIKQSTGVTQRQTSRVYEPSLSEDDEFSDSEPETSLESATVKEKKVTVNGEDSSLLQILDSWYSIKEGRNTRKLKAEKDGVQDVLQSSNCEAGFSSDAAFRNKDETKNDDNMKLVTESVDGMINCSSDGLEIDGQEESDHSRKLKTQKTDCMLDKSNDYLEMTNFAEGAVNTETTLGNTPKNHKLPKKEYVFVTDALDGKKDRLIDGILDSLKKSGEPKMHN